MKAEIPKGVINIIFGDGPITGAALVSSANVDGVYYTGHTRAGGMIRDITSSDVHKKIHLELGGRNSILVFADSMEKANGIRQKTIDIAARVAFENQGETFLGGFLILVERNIYELFVRELASYVDKNYSVGKNVGPVVSEEAYNQTCSCLRLAVDRGASFELGAVPLPLEEKPRQDRGYLIPPVILTGGPDAAETNREVLSGPVVMIAPFDNESQAVKMASQGGQALISVVLTNDGLRQRRVGEQLPVQTVWANCLTQQEAVKRGSLLWGINGCGIVFQSKSGGDQARDVFTYNKTVYLPDC